MRQKGSRMSMSWVCVLWVCSMSEVNTKTSMDGIAFQFRCRLLAEWLNSIWCEWVSVGFPSVGYGSLIFIMSFSHTTAGRVGRMESQAEYSIVMWSRNFSCSLTLNLMANVSMVGDDGRPNRWVSCKGAWLPRISNTYSPHPTSSSPRPNNIDYNTNVRPFGWLSTCMHVWFSSFSFLYCVQYILVCTTYMYKWRSRTPRSLQSRCSHEKS